MVSGTTHAKPGDLANYRRRLRTLTQHHDNRDPATGKAIASVEGGRIAGQAHSDRDPEFGARLAAQRWHPGSREDGSGGDA